VAWLTRTLTTDAGLDNTFLDTEGARCGCQWPLRGPHWHPPFQARRSTAGRRLRQFTAPGLMPSCPGDCGEPGFGLQGVSIVNVPNGVGKVQRLFAFESQRDQDLTHQFESAFVFGNNDIFHAQ
jgi:hypothetical protein